MAKKNKVIEILGIWEEIYNPNFNSQKFEGIRNQAGLKRFVLSEMPIAKQAAAQFEIKVRQQAIAQLTQNPCDSFNTVFAQQVVSQLIRMNSDHLCQALKRSRLN